jgi:uncharacterized YigZ family protein
MANEKIKKLKKTAEIEFTEKKSLFIAIATPINSEEEALEFIKQRKKKYADATHNVYAYTLGDGTLSRYSDDAEPQGTAGMPALNAIRMSGITDVCVVITRYFGGILLGAGGLVRAYSTSASMALEAGGIAVYEEYIEVKSTCTYSDYQKLLPILTSYEAIVDETEFSSDVNLKFAISKEIFEDFKLKINEAFAGKVLLEISGVRLDCK